MTTHTRNYRSYWLTPDITAAAAINYFDGVLFDWAAYVGVGTDLEYIAQNGEKLHKTVAAAMFPELPIDHYRE